jgi:PPP family 3-phenylpropionic acid transporter
VLVGTALAGSLCLIPLLVVRDFGGVLLVLAAVGLLHGTLIPMVDATVMDHLHALGGDYGRLRLWGSISFILGAVGSAPLVAAFSPAVVPLLLVVSALTLAPALAQLPRGQHGDARRFRAPWRLLTPPLAAFLSVAFLVQMSCGAWTGFFGVYTESLGFSVSVPGITWGLAVVAEIGFFFWARGLVARTTPATLILVALVVTVVRWVLTAVVEAEARVIGIQVGHAFTFSLFHLATQLVLTRLVPPESSTSGQALYGLVAMGLGGSLGLWTAGALVGPLGTRGLFACEAAIAALALWPALRLRRLLGG